MNTKPTSKSDNAICSVEIGNVLGNGGYCTVCELMVRPKEKDHQGSHSRKSRAWDTINLRRGTLSRKDSISTAASSIYTIDEDVNTSPQQQNQSFRTYDERGPRDVKYILQRVPSEKFVIKMIRNGLPKPKRERSYSSLLNEADILSSLSHPHIVNMKTLIQEKPDNPTLVIERVGRTLRSTLPLWKDERDLSSQLDSVHMQKRLVVGRGIAAALVYLHGKNIIMRDIKPDNIGIIDDTHAKIFDFGLSKILKDSDKTIYEGRYLATQCVGSVKYMAPEVYCSTMYGVSADIYSFTLVLWEILSMQTCFMKYENAQEMARYVYQRGQRPHVPWSWDIDLKKLLKKGWNKDTSKRPTAHMIEKVLNSLIVEA